MAGTGDPGPLSAGIRRRSGPGLVYIGTLCNMRGMNSRETVGNDLLRASARLSRWASAVLAGGRPGTP